MNSLRTLLLLCCCVFLVGALNGCAKMDPATTVTIEITGLSDQSEVAPLLEMLSAVADKSTKGKRLQSRFDGKQLTVDLSPVSDVDAFVKRIDFGAVTAVSGRTIKVHFVGQGATLRI